MPRGSSANEGSQADRASEPPTDGLDPKFQAFLEAAPDAIVVVDPAGRIVAVNQLVETMFGHARANLIGQSVEVLVPDRYRGGHAQERERYFRNPRTRPMGLDRDLWGRRANGDEFPIQISLSPIETERGPLVTSIIRDVTPLRLAEARFRGLLESAPDGIVVVNSGGTIVIVNSQTETMFGYPREELIGQPIEMLVPGRYRTRHVHDRDTYMAGPRTRPMGAGRLLTGRRKDGREFPVEISLSPLETQGESLVMSIVRDVTERRRAEERMEAALREKEALLKEIHHRVKNNLQVTSSLLRLQASTIANPEARAIFEETQSRIRSIALVHEKLYRSDDLSQVDFTDYVRSLAELLFRSLTIDADKVGFEVVGGDVLLPIDIAVPCGLIVNELLSNALKHAFPADRGGRIRIVLERREDGRNVLVVSDDGVGIPSAVVPDAGGTLGLKLVRGLVQQIDGSLTIRTGAPGAEFRVEFPGTAVGSRGEVR